MVEQKSPFVQALFFHPRMVPAPSAGAGTAGPTPRHVRPSSQPCARASPEVVVAAAGPGRSGPTTELVHRSRAQVVVANLTVGNAFDGLKQAACQWW